LGLGSLGTNALFATWRPKGHSVLVVKLVPTVRCVIIAPIKKGTLSIHPTFPKKITFKFFDYRMLNVSLTKHFSTDLISSLTSGIIGLISTPIIVFAAISIFIRDSFTITLGGAVCIESRRFAKKILAMVVSF